MTVLSGDERNRTSAQLTGISLYSREILVRWTGEMKRESPSFGARSSAVIYCPESAYVNSRMWHVYEYLKPVD
jgi:hypothetical protein